MFVSRILYPHRLYRLESQSQRCRIIESAERFGMIYRPKDGPRYVYREQVTQRVLASPCLSEKFPELKALAVDLGHFNPEGLARNSQIKFTPNLDTAKSVFRVDCPNQGCIGGDFDLTKTLAKAVAEHRTSVKAEMCLSLIHI